MSAPPTNRESAPVDWDDPATWAPSRAFIYLTLAALMLGAALVAAALIVFAPQNQERLLGPALIAGVALIGGWLVYTGRIVSARYFMACGIWVIFTLIAAFTGGVRAPVALAYPLLILMCGWQIGKGAAAAGAVATVLAAIVLMDLEQRQHLPAAPLYLPAMHASVLIVVSLLAAFMIHLLVSAYRRKLHQLHASREEIRRRSGDLETNRATLQRAQAVASVGSWTFDLLANRIQLSAEACRIFGLPERTETDTDSYLARVHEGDRELLQEAWAAALRGASFDHEHRIMAESQVRWIRQKAEFERADNGQALRALGITQDITERKQADERIAELAFYDQLSGLPNRTLLQDRLKQVMAASKRDGGLSALLFLDLDNFKSLNDTRGHDMGDLLLRQVAKRLLDSVRTGDTVARFGGDEFVVILSGLGLNEAVAVIAAEAAGGKLLAALSKPYLIGNQHHGTTCSIGITLFGGTQSESIEEPLKRADLAMYQAKAVGRNSVRFFELNMQAAVSDRMAMEQDIRAALALGQFVLHFQPVVNGLGVVIGAEALIRWQHPLRGLVPPAEFIGVAEETGLILPLGEWVLAYACRQLASWSDKPEFANLTLAVNVSARQFRQQDFVAQVLAALAQAATHPSRLKLELTESLLVTNMDDVIVKMNALKEHGVGFALDDFGTGYSSLSYLGHLPLDQLKIDRSFVKDIETSVHARAISAATISMAHSLGLQVVAEGVESQAQSDFLCRDHGCDYLQGYLFSQPVPPPQFETYVRHALSARFDST